MAQQKFDNVDRNRVIRAVEDLFQVELTKVGRRPKWLRDASGKNYWILGGYGEWHGVPQEMMDAEIASQTEGYLILVVRKKSSMGVYCTGLAGLKAGRSKLYRAGKTTGDYQFTYKPRGNHLIIEQLRSVSLARIAMFDYANVEKSSDIAASELRKLMARMSDEERRQLLASLIKNET